MRASATLLVGEVLSPTNTQSDMEAKKGRYAGAGIPWYWEVTIARDVSAIAVVRAFALATELGPLPDGVHLLRRGTYALVGEWTPADTDGVHIEFPFTITIPWTDLEY